MRGLKGKVAAVTGAGSGIGQAAAKRLAEEGCRVAVIDWKRQAAEDTLAQIRKAGGEAHRFHRRCRQGRRGRGRLHAR